MLASQGALIELTEQVDSLQRQTAELRGRTETLEHSTEGTTDRQRDLYVDLDDRLRALEQKRTLTQPPVTQSAAAPVARRAARAGRHGSAELRGGFRAAEAAALPGCGAAFGQFLVSFPDSQLADNAQYWLAESYYVTDQFEEALSQFQVVLSQFPRSRRCPTPC